MNRSMRRASATNGKRLQRLDWNAFQDTTTEALARHVALNPTSRYKPDRIWANNRYIVQAFFGRQILGLNATKLMIRRCDAEPIYSWQDLQRIKNEIFGPEAEAVQMFPQASELVDDANIYWLWVLEKDAP